ncbi:unnamed protein product [Polarella glacialis]|uniref:Uncharacterized protein n=1 Tax=Polarella glacialis TaxID=89957 RepID=A0A813JLD0_POLGL|nr:unnamed protein product [Polarella glacialis]
MPGGRTSPTGATRSGPPPATSRDLGARAASAESGAMPGRGVVPGQALNRLEILAEKLEGLGSNAPGGLARSSSPCNRSSSSALQSGASASGATQAAASAVPCGTKSRARPLSSVGSVASGSAEGAVSSSTRAPEGVATAEGRLRSLETELAQFTSKMDEMREAASSLHDQVQNQRSGSEPPSNNREGLRGSPSQTPSWAGTNRMSSAGGFGHGAGASAANAGALANAGSSGSSWVVQALQRTFAREDRSSPGSTEFGMSEAQLGMELRMLRQELRAEAEVRKQGCSRLEVMVQDETRQREEAVSREAAQRDEAASRLEQHWHGMVKEESAVRRAVESHLEARLAAVQREVRLEIGTANSQNQQLSSSVAQLRDSLRRELDSQRMEISTASFELAKLMDKLKHEGRGHGSLDGEKPALDMPSAELITESLVRAEVRRQLAEVNISAMSGLHEEPPTSSAAIVNQAQASERLSRLETMLGREVLDREEADSKLLASLHELASESRRSLERGQLDLEQRLQAKTEIASADARSARQECKEEQRQRKESVEHEVKEREETCFMLLKSLEDKIYMERKRFDDQLQEIRTGSEDGLYAHEQVVQRQLQATLEATVGSVVERSTKELLTTRQDLLELREELQDGLRAERERREQAITRLSAPMSARGEGSSNVGVLQSQVKFREELLTDLDAVREELRREALTRKEDVQGVRSSLDRVREQVTGLQFVPPGTPADEASASAHLSGLRAALAAEIQAREEADDLCMSTVQELVREERQSRERGYQALELRVQSEEQTIFVESGKREERDRDILAQMAKVDEELDTVKRQVVGSLQQRHLLDDMQQANDATARRLESRIIELSDRLEDESRSRKVPEAGSLTSTSVGTPTSEDQPLVAMMPGRSSLLSSPGSSVLAGQVYSGFPSAAGSSRPGSAPGVGPSATQMLGRGVLPHSMGRLGTRM